MSQKLYIGLVRSCGRSCRLLLVRACARGRALGLLLARSCGHSFVRSCGRSFVRLCGRSFVLSCGRSCVRFFVRLFVRLLDRCYDLVDIYGNIQTKPLFLFSLSVKRFSLSLLVKRSSSLLSFEAILFLSIAIGIIKHAKRH